MSVDQETASCSPETAEEPFKFPVTKFVGKIASVRLQSRKARIYIARFSLLDITRAASKK